MCVTPILALITLLTLLPCQNSEISLPCKQQHEKLLIRTRAAIYHAYEAYKHNALPYDELRPLSCRGADTFGGLSVTLVDTLDTFIILNDWPEFIWSARYLRNNLSFDKNTTVSVFETTIRVLGGLLSAHGFLTGGFDDTGFDAWLWWPNYDDSLLYLAYQLAERLLPAFNTPTGIPFGAVNLIYGVEEHESRIASTAGAGSLLLEFGTLSRLTGLDVYYNFAFHAMQALHQRAADTGLVGNHIDIDDGHWVATESGIGGLIDSFYEYMYKGYILFGDERLLQMFEKSYRAVKKYVKKGVWYLDADMWTGRTISSVQSSLSAFFPGLQVLLGEYEAPAATTRAHYAVWRKYGALPEGFDVVQQLPQKGRVNYPLRPELVESLFYLHWRSGDPVWVSAAEGVLRGLESIAKVDCGFAQVRDVSTREVDDLMDSFVVSETLKYLYMILLDEAHWTRSGSYVFTTEAHPLRIPRIRTAHPAKKARKCLREKVYRKLPCGYSVPDSDLLPVKKHPPEAVAMEVALQVELLVQKYGMGALDIGRLFVGRKHTYRVARVVGEQVFFTRLGRESECGRRWGREVVKGVCVWRM